MTLKFNSEEEALAWALRNAPSNHVEKEEKRLKTINVPTEHSEQCSLVYWTEIINIGGDQYPDIDLIYAIPNGGDRHQAVAAKLKAEGVKSGVPDLCLPVPRGTFHGLYIEMKRLDGGSGTSDNQKTWICRLMRQGYKVVVCNGWEEARVAIENYYSLGPFKDWDQLHAYLRDKS